VAVEEEGEDTKGGAEDEGDTDISSNIGGSREDIDSERDMPYNPWDLLYRPRKLRGG